MGEAAQEAVAVWAQAVEREPEAAAGAAEPVAVAGAELAVVGAPELAAVVELVGARTTVAAT